MGRKVFISSDMSTDPRLDEVAETRSDLALLWPWFLTVFDDWGRAEADGRALKQRLFPGNRNVTLDAVEEAIEWFHRVRLVHFYSVDGRPYVACLDYLGRHRFLPGRPSRFPDPDPVDDMVIAYLERCRTWPMRTATPWLKHRRRVFQRDGWRCIYCGSGERLTIDHVVPRSQGGSDEPENLVAACWPCNRHKWARTPEEAGMQRMANR